jgi:hypothetical protein
MNNSSMTLRPSKFVERGNIDTLTQIHDLSLSWFTLNGPQNTEQKTND